MNNIYDVILNFNKYYYEIYEWKKSDEIENVRKLPFFKVSDKVFLTLRDNDVKIGKNTMDNLRKNCTMLDEKIHEITCLVTNGYSCMGIKINKEGYVIGRSAMLYDEEDEVLEESRDIKITDFKFADIKAFDLKESRLEREKKQILYDFINNISDKMILKYIYYDYYLDECDDISKIKSDILNEIKGCQYNNLFRLYDCVMLFYNYAK